MGAACGAEHSICVTEGGKVFAWGWGRYGNLGIGDCSDQSEPMAMKGLEGVTVEKVACGWRHSMLVDNAGRLFSCGWSKYGQLGHGDFVDRSVPAVVSALAGKPVKVVDGGWRHTVAATDGALYAWGWNKFGQLGVGFGPDVPEPQPVEPLSREGAQVALIACGWKHTLVVTAGGELYAWGRGTNGQLATRTSKDMCAPWPGVLILADTPTRVDCLCKGEVDLESLEYGVTGSEQMFVPACERYAVVPGNHGSLPMEVPCVANIDEAATKKPRLS